MNKMLKLLTIIAELTNTRVNEWTELDAPQTGVGTDYWFKNKNNNSEVYVNEDQGYLTVVNDEETIYSGFWHDLE